ncbi:MAG: hypothetical protein M1833_002049 [Piccolia ochrophora]|nr:MAG: hypothetical protein M1833_002049 [Piccolia ochrophora]
MDPFTALGAAGSAVGIASFGLQLATTLTSYVESAFEAGERIKDIADEISSTAGALQSLEELVDLDRSGAKRAKIFNGDGLKRIQQTARQCYTIFKRIIAALNKAGKAADNDFEKTDREIKLSGFEHLKWPWLQPQIDRYRADLERQKVTLLLMLQIATLGRSKKAASDISKRSSKPTEEQQELAKRIAGLEDRHLEANRRYYRLRAGLQVSKREGSLVNVVEVQPSGGKPHGMSREPSALPSAIDSAEVEEAGRRPPAVIERPRIAANDPLANVQEMKARGTSLEAYVITTIDKQNQILPMSFSQEYLLDVTEKLRSRKRRSTWNRYKILTATDQLNLSNFLISLHQRENARSNESRNQPSAEITRDLLAIDIRKHHRVALGNVLKSLFCMYGYERSSSSIFIVLQRHDAGFQSRSQRDTPMGEGQDRYPDNDMIIRPVHDRSNITSTRRRRIRPSSIDSVDGQQFRRDSDGFLIPGKHNPVPGRSTSAPLWMSCKRQSSPVRPREHRNWSPVDYTGDSRHRSRERNEAVRGRRRSSVQYHGVPVVVNSTLGRYRQPTPVIINNHSASERQPVVDIGSQGPDSRHAHFGPPTEAARTRRRPSRLESTSPPSDPDQYLSRQTERGRVVDESDVESETSFTQPSARVFAGSGDPTAAPGDLPPNVDQLLRRYTTTFDEEQRDDGEGAVVDAEGEEAVIDGDTRPSAETGTTPNEDGRPTEAPEGDEGAGTGTWTGDEAVVRY